MYFRDLETDAQKKRDHDAAMRSASSERLKQVAAKMKLKRQAKKDS